MEKNKYKDLPTGKGLCWLKQLKNGLGQGFTFHAIISALLVKLKCLYISAACLNLNYGTVKQ